MTHSKILAMAKSMGITNPSKMKEGDLIRAIQEKEGNTACFDTGLQSCDQTECAWRENCIK
ncbi:MAG: SAP domain-containing protein [Fibrobacter sp.]|nr:SAP domain-containing protein [Fibrobacter sp.]